jgi:hypothetical protein
MKDRTSDSLDLLNGHIDNQSMEYLTRRLLAAGHNHG